MIAYAQADPYAVPHLALKSSTSPAVHRPGKRRRWRTVLIVVGVLVLVRIALPYILLHFANKRLASMPNYYGHIADLDLSLIRGAYVIDRFYLDKKDSVSQELTPFMSADLIDLSVEWRALFDGSIVGELVLEHPELRFTKEAAEPAAALKDTADFRSLLKDFMPLRVNRVEAHNGVLRYVDPGSTPKVDVQLDALEALVLNLTNSADSAKLLPSTLRATAQLYGGQLKLSMGLAPLADSTRFDMNAELVHTDLTRINDLFKAYGHFDVNKGTFGLYTEMATRDGAFKGYVKPLIKDLDVVGPEDRPDGLFQKLWEAVVGAAGGFLKNPAKEQVATKVAFEGRLDHPEVGAWGAITTSLRNAFVEALPPTIDNEINIATVGKNAPEKKKGFFKKLFGKSDKKAK
jgi:hypothetical protein